ncbi:SRPBCC domain-containing protein [Pseudenhygromyxa sp. WMMC2535]|uniref:SRPBCC domain-containing protein n=1 Tax=Pseudenhygromyxa sp. WMMC2535 TaxID=2712867 RepID=UPI001556F8D1|nr:SRPBCC domain-containing protein [Pseudenhygromyxa sp. WMMC2535]NVB36198.1 SRPBCC domain-containing protein [Pseudenhygromyxa sp. WMMC2535]NVB43397.1 SRPBCC domain-containing protein [Pseudenhygromyxa sp. WMMC2535]
MISLRHTLYVAARPEELWAALTEGEQTRRYYMGARAESTLEVGAPLQMFGDPARSEDDDSPDPDPDSPESRVLAIRGEIRACEPEAALAHSFAFCDLDEPSSELRWRLSVPEGATKVVRLDLEHELPEGCAATLDRVREAWPMVLCGLKTWLETGEALGLDGLSSA